MKPGFGNKKNKNRKKKNKKGGAAGKGDTAMQDAPEVASEEGAPDDIDYAFPTESEAGQPLTGKDKHKRKLDLKSALKVKVANLKQTRAKMTKLSGNKGPGRKELSTQLKELVKEQHDLSKKSKQAKGQQAPAAAKGQAQPAGDSMLE